MHLKASQHARHTFYVSRCTIAVVSCLMLIGASRASAQVAGVEHVVVIGVDGLSPDGLRNAETPRMDQLMNEGAFSLKARAVRPTSSSPNWASMIMGAAPEQHGITSNGWNRNNFSIAPVTRGPESIFPTIFSVLREARPEAYIACIYDWGGFGRLFEHSAVDLAFDARDPQDAVDVARMVFAESRPTLTFIHLDHVDRAGHGYGWGSETYKAAVEEADGYIDEVMRGLENAGMAERTIVIIVSDHGGRGNGHGGDSMDELEIPWIMHGPGVDKDIDVPLPVYTYDTAATIATIFGLAQPYAWIGRAVTSAFESGVITAVERTTGPEPAPVQFSLSQSYPNPFNPKTQFALTLAQRQHIQAAVYDVQGRRLAPVHDGVLRANREHILTFEASGLPSGLYLIHVVGETFSATRSVVLLK